MTDYASEFPAFHPDSIPAAVTGLGWMDLSWRNDPCPFFLHDASGVGVWLNYAGADMTSEAKFQVVALKWVADAGWQHSGSDLDLFETDDADQLARSLPNFTLPRGIASAFADLIEQECADDLDAIRTRNASEAYKGCCASHDFCDANMPMAAAFEAITGRPLVGDAGIADADLELVNMAWDIARAERLTGKADPDCIMGLHSWISDTAAGPGTKCTRCGESY